MFKTLKTFLLGEPLKSELEGDSHALTKLQALAMLSSDALSSIAYGPEQVILVLIALSEGAIWWSLPIGIGVLVLLITVRLFTPTLMAVVLTWYHQTICLLLWGS